MRRANDDVLLYVIAALFVSFSLLAGAGLLSAFLSGHGLPTHHVRGVFTSFAHAGDPSIAWPVPVGPSWLYWSTTATVVLGGGVATTFAVRYAKHEERQRVEDPTRALGLADRRDMITGGRGETPAPTRLDPAAVTSETWADGSRTFSRDESGVHFNWILKTNSKIRQLYEL